MRVFANRLVDGREIALPQAISVEVVASLSSPARSLHCNLAVNRFPAELGAMRVESPAGRLFEGRVDKQVSAVSAAGRRLTLEARSMGALLLDNEAAPCVLENVTVSTVFGVFIAPYGFVLHNPTARGRSLAQYTVCKGLSEWEALTGFTRRVYGRTPFVIGDQVVLERSRSAAPLVIGGAGLAYTALEQAVAPYEVLSKVVLRDIDGIYNTAVHNSSATYYGVRRKRYVIPPTEFVDDGALDANQRIRASMLRRERVTVTLPGLVDVAVGREVRIADEALPLHNLLADTVTWKQDAAGLTTTLELVSSIYCD